MRNLTLQRLGQTMEAGRIERWLKQEGDAFATGEPLYEVETDKVTVEVEAADAGRLVRILAEDGAEIDVGVVVAVVADPEETWTPEAVEAYIADLASVSAAPLAQRTDPEEERVADTPGSATTGIAAMPLARRRATELGVDLRLVVPTGADGVITVDDVEEVAAGGGDEIARVRERRSLTQLERRMAAAVLESWRTVPQFVQHVEVCADGVIDAHRRFRADAESSVT
ncbi:MAG TPA: biotin/lipoyl-containing protein, partial [Fimbriimonadaceae bacterium]|nr:biotin/lipoyl-containing protein [Fimbriimonadaceae bacterium]